MFFPEGRNRVHLYGRPCDMRKSFDGLFALTRNELQLDPALRVRQPAWHADEGAVLRPQRILHLGQAT